MRFLLRKRRNPPSVIIVSLIDVLMVVLIFLVVSTTFKQQPAIKLALPVSKQAKEGATENAPLVVTVAKQEPHLYLGDKPVTIQRLEEELALRVSSNPQATLSIRADTDAPFGEIVKVMDAARAAKIQSVTAFTKPAK
ncbi:MAG: biopolymer transporter ExbD [Verrucomicrobia bacterium]|nr:biopolymer transporter ExbD [Verrucomicrobiota bacterium]